ncbi:hypothetical protein Tco_0585253, partial [Tanacetum coccineum]
LSTQNFTDKGIVDSGCSRHMTGNKAYVAEYQDFNGGPSCFGGMKGTEDMFVAVSTVSPYVGLSFFDPTNPYQDDSEIPALEDFYKTPTDGIFINSSYDDEGAVVDFTNLETVVNYIQKQRRNNHKDFQHCLFAYFLSQNEPKKISEALEDESWVDAMQEELLNKKDERGVVVRNKAWLVAQGHRQEEGIDYDEVTPKTSHLSAVKRIFRYLKGKPKLGLWYPRVSSFDLEPTQIVNMLSKSLTEIQQQENPVYHSKTKHIAIRHHFIRDAYEKKLIQVLKIHTDDNVADLLTKAFDVSRFQFLVVTIGMINP